MEEKVKRETRRAPTAISKAKKEWFCKKSVVIESWSSSGVELKEKKETLLSHYIIFSADSGHPRLKGQMDSGYRLLSIIVT